MYNFSTEPNIKRLELLFLIRESELLLAKKAEEKYFKTPIHLGIGQEAVATGVSENLRKSDFIFGNHRSHAHYLAAGGSLYRLFAEILGKPDGCSGGKGGSMHITSPDVGFIGSMPIVAGTIPIALGAALTCKLQGKGNISISYFGDGATEEGVFHETLNLASIMSLPILFVCENNLLSSHLHISERQPSSDIIRFAVANNINASVVDGNDLLEVAQKTSEIVTKIRSTNQPAFIEANTYRLYGHVGYEIDYEVGLNREEDLKAWNNRDPIEKYKEWLIGKQKIKAKVISEIHETVTTFVEEKWNEAVQAPESNQNQLLKNVYFEEAE
jgi:pyruvate dehydrogenase E1 component alpha subunit